LVKRTFAISTHLYHSQRLGRDHLLEIAAHGFESVEVFATRTHVDYHNPAMVADLQQWLAEAGLELHGIHAPIADSFGSSKPGVVLSLASADPDARARAVAEAERALHIARRIPARVLVVHLGQPKRVASPGESSRDGARRSVEALVKLAEPLGVRVALEIIPNELSRAGSLVHFVEDDLEGAEVGVCLDVGHAHMNDDLVDAIETVSEHLQTVDLHDNHGRTDEHLVPFEGTIDWPAALTAIQKIGYDGTLVLEVGPRGTTKETLARAQQARKRIDAMLTI
jgi:sugar phosphate isomerase/epimerase